ncbi:hypothetical protein L5515_006485 [Caenorhabditis briggsae]|uniref:C2H2-type domain-containing protein n=1 Tax=Caenorhabditis briggsae TaxID=6238 RepID=A0AAE9F4L9_CAEBR|nr:hypothetical protein L5515_006485 [Caenorhabditis briggsae]
MTKQDLINFLQASTTPNVVEKTCQANGKYFKVNETEFEQDAEKLVIEERKKFPETKNIGVYAMAAKITRLDFPIGAPINLPQYILDSKTIKSLQNVDNNMCFWYCVAVAEGCREDRASRKAKELFANFYGAEKRVTNYVGFDYVNELDKYEKFNEDFAVNIVSYYEDKTISYVRKSSYNASRKPIYLNLYFDHFSYITDLSKLSSIFMCQRCGSKFKDNFNLDRHHETCTLTQEDVFCKHPTLWKKDRNLIVELADTYGVDVDFKYDYMITFDMESRMQKMSDKVSDKLTYTMKHIPTSVAIATNVPGFEDDKFILNEDPEQLVKEMFKWFDDVGSKASQLMLEKMEPLLCRLESNEWLETKVQRYCEVIPILGFNSSFYDINLISRPFIQEIMKRREYDGVNPMVIKEGNRYKTIKTGQFQFLDQMSYVAAGTKLESFIKAYVNVQKGWFPYEWFDSYDKLNYLTHNLTIEDFNSSLNGSMPQENFDDLMKICVDKNLVTVRDLLEWYNILDVRPMLEACLKQKEFFYTFKLDMYKDACSLPGLSENILYQFQISGFEEYLKEKPKKIGYYTPIEEIQINKRIDGYRQQDEKAKRPPCDLTVDCVREILENGNHRCIYCWLKLCSYTWSLDRIDNALPHTKSNCVVSCIKCNKARSDKMFKEFYRHKAMLRFEKDHPMIWLFGEENKDAFYKFKKNITGGASIVFHRYHEANKTEITRTHYDDTEWAYPEKGKAVKKIVGFDANALYLHSLGEEMPCGKLYFKENDDWSKIEKQVLDNSLFGFLEVDIEVPKDKWNYFSEMCPIFVNKEYDETLCGDYTLNLLKSLERKPTKSRKLVVTLKAKQILIKSTRLRWMLEHGCVVTKLYGYIEAKRRRIFKGFMDWVSDERRKGDVDSKYAIISEGAKLVGNSAFGRTGMDKNKHKKVSFCNEVQFNRAKNDYFYYDAEEYNGVYEVTKRTRKVKQNMPLQIACSVYDDSKLRMLKFYYDCIDKYVDRSDFQYIEMDTDSAYMAITDNTLEDLIKPEMKEEFERDKCNWFPRTDTEEHRRIDKRTPGLFKVEKEGDECLVNKQTIDGLNKGFRYQNQEMKTYEQKKIGLSPVYGKGVVMDDGIHIRPIIFE